MMESNNQDLNSFAEFANCLHNFQLDGQSSKAKRFKESILVLKGCHRHSYLTFTNDSWKKTPGIEEIMEAITLLRALWWGP